MPYICLDENDTIQKGDTIIWQDGSKYVFKTSWQEDTVKECLESSEGIVVLRWEDPKTRCLDESELLQKSDTVIGNLFNTGDFHLTLSDDSIATKETAKFLFDNYNWIVAVLRSTENE